MCIPGLLVSFRELIYRGKDVFFNYYNFNLNYYSALSWSIQAFQFSIPILIIIYLSREAFYDYGFNKISIKESLKSFLRLLGLTLLSSLIFGIISLVIIMFYKGFNYETMYNLIQKEENTSTIILVNILPIMLRAFTEELCFRSFLYNNLRKIINGKWICIIVVNLLFAIGHIYQGIMGVAGAFIIGIVFSIEFQKHNNIYTISIFHGLRNLLTFFIRSPEFKKQVQQKPGKVFCNPSTSLAYY